MIETVESRKLEIRKSVKELTNQYSLDEIDVRTFKVLIKMAMAQEIYLGMEDKFSRAEKRLEKIDSKLGK